VLCVAGMTCIADNSQLKDMGNLLQIQSSSGLGTYVGSNPVLCFSVPQLWARRNDSYLEYGIASVSLSWFCMNMGVISVTMTVSAVSGSNVLVV
jgi:hypothetical protein